MPAPAPLPAAAQRQALRILLGQERRAGPLEVALYANDRAPTPGDEAGDYREPAGFGYARLRLDASEWRVRDGNPSVAEYPPVTFEFSGAAGPVYGYFVLSDGALLWAERFADGPYAVRYPGDSIAVLLRVELG